MPACCTQLPNTRWALLSPLWSSHQLANLRTHPAHTHHIHPPTLVSRGQTLFRTEGKGLGFGHRATCCPALWSVYQSQHSIQSHGTWSMWLTGKFKISVWIEREPELWEVRTEREVSWDISWNTAESKSRVQKVASLTLPSFARLPWLIKFLGDKLLYGHIPDHFPQCGIGSGHTRLVNGRVWKGAEGLTFKGLK